MTFTIEQAFAIFRDGVNAGHSYTRDDFVAAISDAVNEDVPIMSDDYVDWNFIAKAVDTAIGER